MSLVRPNTQHVFLVFLLTSVTEKYTTINAKKNECERKQQQRKVSTELEAQTEHRTSYDRNT